VLRKLSTSIVVLLAPAVASAHTGHGMPASWAHHLPEVAGGIIASAAILALAMHLRSNSKS
jgi:hypothetical protein